MEGSKSVAYRYPVSKVTLGNEFTLNDFPVHITFDSRVTMPLLGMSLLGMFTFVFAPQNRSIVFQSTEIAHDYVTGNQSCLGVEDKIWYDHYTDFIDLGIENTLQQLSSPKFPSTGIRQMSLV